MVPFEAGQPVQPRVAEGNAPEEVLVRELVSSAMLNTVVVLVGAPLEADEIVVLESGAELQAFVNIRDHLVKTQHGR